MMKSLFITLLITSFIGVAVFGSFSMIYGDTHNGGCIASNPAMGGSAACPLHNSLIFLVFHLDAFKYFSTAIVAVILLVLAAGISFSILPRPLNNDEEEDFAFLSQAQLISAFPKIRRINRWLSLHINSPAFAPARHI